MNNSIILALIHTFTHSHRAMTVRDWMKKEEEERREVKKKTSNRPLIATWNTIAAFSSINSAIKSKRTVECSDCHREGWRLRIYTFRFEIAKFAFYSFVRKQIFVVADTGSSRYYVYCHRCLPIPGYFIFLNFCTSTWFDSLVGVHLKDKR